MALKFSKRIKISSVINPNIRTIKGCTIKVEQYKSGLIWGKYKFISKIPKLLYKDFKHLSILLCFTKVVRNYIKPIKYISDSGPLFFINNSNTKCRVTVISYDTAIDTST